MSHSIRSPLRVVVGLAALSLLGGCLAPRPAGIETIQLTTVNSARMSLWDVRFEQRRGQVFLSGSAMRHYPAADEDTTRTHLRITLFIAGGGLLREFPADFEPRVIPRGNRAQGYSSFSVPLGVLPERVVRVQVLAYDEIPPDPPSAERLRP